MQCIKYLFEQTLFILILIVNQNILKWINVKYNHSINEGDIQHPAHNIKVVPASKHLNLSLKQW